eukprot:92350-Pelagomonas_calceolata.AAC.3
MPLVAAPDPQRRVGGMGQVKGKGLLLLLCSSRKANSGVPKQASTTCKAKRRKNKPEAKCMKLSDKLVAPYSVSATIGMCVRTQRKYKNYAWGCQQTATFPCYQELNQYLNTMPTEA